MNDKKETDKKPPMNDVAKLVLVDQMVKEVQDTLNDTHASATALRLGHMLREEMAKRRGYEQKSKRMQTFYDGITPKWKNETKETVVKRLIDAGDLFGKCYQQAIMVKSLIDQLIGDDKDAVVSKAFLDLREFTDKLVEMMTPPEKEAESGGQ